MKKPPMEMDTLVKLLSGAIVSHNLKLWRGFERNSGGSDHGSFNHSIIGEMNMMHDNV
jgi:hypothetical protein